MYAIRSYYVPNKAYGDDGLMLFGDCAVNPCPTAEQLAAIAISSAVTAKSLCGMEPRVAMLSFSTKGSAKHELVDKVVEATRIAHELAPELNVDGELQADAALVEKVGKLKSPGSTVAGKANILIFPDLQAGNPVIRAKTENCCRSRQWIKSMTSFQSVANFAAALLSKILSTIMPNRYGIRCLICR